MMEIWEVNHESISRAVSVLREGGVGVYPTETAYAVGGDATSRSVIKKVYVLKGREGNKPLPVICSDMDMVLRIVELPDMCRVLAEEYWPGPLTLILPSRGVLPSELTGGKESIAVRISHSPIATQLCRGLGAPVISTSANPAGGGNIYHAQEIVAAFSHQESAPDFFLNSGDLPQRPSSTIVDCTGEKLRVVRQGEIVIAPEYL